MSLIIRLIGLSILIIVAYFSLNGPAASHLTTMVYQYLNPNSANSTLPPLKDDQIKPTVAYSTSRTVNVALVFLQEEASLPEALISLWRNLQANQSYRQIVYLVDQQVTPSWQDQFLMDSKQYFAVNTERIFLNSDENVADLQTRLQQFADTETLFVLITKVIRSTDPQLVELENSHFKNFINNLDLDNLASIRATSPTGLRALLGWMNEHQIERPLKGLDDPERHYQIRYFGQGIKEFNQRAIITFTGDIMLDRLVRTRMNQNGLEYPFQKLDPAIYLANDLSVANLEGPIAEKRLKTTKSIAFQFLPDVVPILQKYGYDLLSLANNHALDMGKANLDFSFEQLQKAGIQPFGVPMGLEERSVAKTVVNGLKIAFLGLNDVDFKFKRDAVYQKVAELTQEGYRVIPFVHWGVEYKHYPEKYQQDIAHALLDAGAIALVGHHPHVVQAIEIYKQKPIFYSLGNAVFDQDFSVPTQEGLIISMQISPENLEVYFWPIDITKSQMILKDSTAKSEFLAKLADWSKFGESEKLMISTGKMTLEIANPGNSL